MSMKCDSKVRSLEIRERKVLISRDVHKAKLVRSSLMIGILCGNKDHKRHTSSLSRLNGTGTIGVQTVV